jgi:hypothetical protein
MANTKTVMQIRCLYIYIYIYTYIYIYYRFTWTHIYSIVLLFQELFLSCQLWGGASLSLCSAECDAISVGVVDVAIADPGRTGSGVHPFAPNGFWPIRCGRTDVHETWIDLNGLEKGSDAASCEHIMSGNQSAERVAPNKRPRIRN